MKNQDPLVRITMQLRTSTRDLLRQKANEGGRSMSKEGVRRIEASLGLTPDAILAAPPSKAPAKRKK